MSATLSRLRQVRSNATERWLKFLEQTERRWPWTVMATDLMRRYRRTGGTVIAGNLAFRFFIWLLPTLVLAIAIVSISARNGVDVESAAQEQLQLGEPRLRLDCSAPCC